MKFIHYIERVSGVDVMGLVSLAGFFLFFTGMLVWVLKTRKNKFTEASRLPLDN